MALERGGPLRFSYSYSKKTSIYLAVPCDLFGMVSSRHPFNGES